jgi:hypothetical protein
MRASAALICLLCVTACSGSSPVGTTVVLNQRFTLAPGDVAVVNGADIRVRFMRVTGDSRCPADAVCILGGDAIVHILAGEDSASSSSYELHTGDSSRASVVHGTARISLVELQPYPFSSRTIAPDDYRATLTVTSR